MKFQKILIVYVQKLTNNPDFEKKKLFRFWTGQSNSESYSEPCQTSKMERFAKIVNGFLLNGFLLNCFAFLQNAPS